jgi:hydroxymethylglutaryl-CoA reductase (NADPH)
MNQGHMTKAPAPLRWPRSNKPEAVAERQQRLQRLTHWNPRDDHIFAWPVPPDNLARFQECLTGHVVLPVGVVGPLPLDLGVYRLTPEGGNLQEEGRVEDNAFIPLAHTEGGLSASMQRGITAVAFAGRVRTYVLKDSITRDTCFVFRTTEEAMVFSRWVEAHVEEMCRWLGEPENLLRAQETEGITIVSRHAILQEVSTHVVGPMCHLLYRYTTGDACGPNMITRNSFALNQGFILARFPQKTGIAPLSVFLETNMGGDKKPSHAYYQFGGHGKTVIAEVTFSQAVLRRVFRLGAEELLVLEHAGLHGTHASGMQSFAFTPASAIAAIFAATGQDLGMVGTSSMAHASATRVEDGIHFSLRFSGLEVGTVGGGTSLPHAQAYLRLMNCLGVGKVYRFAQIIAAAALCLEVSAAASMATSGSRNFFQAHLERGGLRGGER